jgi:hypothetical protein
MASIYSNIRTDRQYSAATGYKLAEFNTLYAVFAKHYFPKRVADNYAGEHPVLTDKREALFFILHYLKAAPTYENLGLYFGISQAAACKYVGFLKPILSESLAEVNALPKQEINTIQEVEAMLGPCTEIAIDISELRTERPDNQAIQKERYSGKKRIIH